MRRSRYKHNSKNTVFALNITSMTDMFTVLLVFLLQNYTTSQVEVKMANNLELPISNSERNPTPAIQLSISKDKIELDGKEIATIEKLNFKGTDIDKNDDQFITPLFNALEEINKKNEAAKAARNPADTKGAAADAEKEGKIIIMADASFSYDVLKKVMYTSSMAGFPQVKLGTLVGY